MKNKFLVFLITLAGTGILLVGIYCFIKMTNLPQSTRITFLTLMLVDSFAYSFIACKLFQQKHWIYPYALLIIILNVIAAIFDDIGLADILAALFNIILILLLFRDWRKIGRNN